MPKTKSARKALRQGARRATRNAAKKRRLRDTVKRFRRALKEGKKDEARAMLPLLFKLLDKAAKTHVISENRARRAKSRLAKAVGAKT